MSAGTVIALAAGGTGGHVFPAQALAHELQSRGVRVILITDHRGCPLTKDFPCDAKMVLTAASPNRRNPVQLLKLAFGLAGSCWRARKFLKQHKCSQIVGFGGYPTVPSLAAARMLGLPIVLHEQNAVLGRSNRLFAGSAKWIASGFTQLKLLPEAARSRHVVTGNPLRPNIISHINASFPNTDHDLHVLVLGGSLGARILSEAVPAAVGLLSKELASRLVVTAQITKDRLASAQQSFKQAEVRAELAPFFEDVAERLARAHLVIARAGASTVSELAAVGRGAILVPLAIAMDDHQSANARVLKAAGAADIIAEEALTPEKLAGLLSARLSDVSNLAQRAKRATLVANTDASAKLADLILNK